MTPWWGIGLSIETVRSTWFISFLIIHPNFLIKLISYSFKKPLRARTKAEVRNSNRRAPYANGKNRQGHFSNSTLRPIVLSGSASGCGLIDMGAVPALLQPRRSLFETTHGLEHEHDSGREGADAGNCKKDSPSGLTTAKQFLSSRACHPWRRYVGNVSQQRAGRGGGKRGGAVGKVGPESRSAAATFRN